LWCGLRVALVAATKEAATVAEWSVGDADITGVVVTAHESKESDGENPEAFHRRFDAWADRIFTVEIRLKTNEFRWITGAS
jgi:coproporphyrinogen III oxidase